LPLRLYRLVTECPVAGDQVGAFVVVVDRGCMIKVVTPADIGVTVRDRISVLIFHRFSRLVFGVQVVSFVPDCKTPGVHDFAFSCFLRNVFGCYAENFRYNFFVAFQAGYDVGCHVVIVQIIQVRRLRC
jgi:hypothetical protein